MLKSDELINKVKEYNIGGLAGELGKVEESAGENGSGCRANFCES